MTFRASFPIFALIILLVSCGPTKGPLKFEDKTLVPFQNAILSGKAPLGFEALQKHILKPKCMSCHSSEAGRAEPEFDPIDFDTYESTMELKFIPLLIKGKPEISRLYEEVHTGSMPIRERLHDKEIEFIANWIRACAPNKPVTTIPEKCKTDDDDDDFESDEF